MGDMQSRYHRHGSGLGIGLAVIAVGVIFLLHNFGIRLPFMEYHNWWALFILIGAIPSLTHALRRFQAQGHFDREVAASLLVAAAVVLVAAMFLLDLRWDLWWPLFMIYGGLWLVVRGHPDRPDNPAN